MNFIYLTPFSVVQHLHSFERFKYFLKEQWLMLCYLASTHYALQCSQNFEYCVSANLQLVHLRSIYKSKHNM